jgi:hypothetical protein
MIQMRLGLGVKEGEENGAWSGRGKRKEWADVAARFREEGLPAV